jgi:hypothetical protein
MLSVNFFYNISSYHILAYITKNYIALIYYAKIVHLLCQFHAGKVGLDYSFSVLWFHDIIIVFLQNYCPTFILGYCFSPRNKIWIYWSESNPWIYFYIILKKTDNFTGLNTVFGEIYYEIKWPKKYVWNKMTSELYYELLCFL